MSTRETITDDDPLVRKFRKAYENNGGTRVNLTKEGTSIHDIEHGDQLEVSVFADRIEIRPTGGDTDG